MVKDIQFVTSEKLGLTQYVHLGPIRKLNNRTMTRRAVSMDNPVSLNIANLMDADQRTGAIPVTDVVLVNGQFYQPDEVMRFANDFNRRGYAKRIVKVLDGDRAIAMERAMIMN